MARIRRHRNKWQVLYRDPANPNRLRNRQLTDKALTILTDIGDQEDSHGED